MDMEKEKAEVKKMNKATIIGLVVVVLFVILPIANGNTVIPSSIGEIEVGEFIGGILNYWITVVRTIIATVKW